MEYTKKHLKALADRVYQYERGIASKDPHSAVCEIMGYCGICESTGGENGWRECRSCGLGPKEVACCKGRMLKSRNRMWSADDGDGNAVAAMKARLADIIRKCDENGIIFE